MCSLLFKKQEELHLIWIAKYIYNKYPFSLNLNNTYTKTTEEDYIDGKALTDEEKNTNLKSMMTDKNNNVVCQNFKYAGPNKSLPTTSYCISKDVNEKNKTTR